jgi:hypothetical protein
MYIGKMVVYKHFSRDFRRIMNGGTGGYAQVVHKYVHNLRKLCTFITGFPVHINEIVLWIRKM